MITMRNVCSRPLLLTLLLLLSPLVPVPAAPPVGDAAPAPSAPPPPALAPNKAYAGTRIGSNLNPSVFGQPVVFTATVTGAGNIPTGTVTFTVDGAAGAAIPLNGGTVTFSVADFSVGSHQVAALYSGDAAYISTTSSALTQTVIAHISPQYVSPSGNDASPGTAALPKRTLQAAINATRSGDAVVVGDGTYTGPGDVDLDFGGRSLTVSSQNGPAACIIDCQGSSSANHRAFNLHSGETGAVIRGLTIQNGYVDIYSLSGGAIYNSGVSVVVQDCILRNNSAEYGGAIANADCGPVTVVNCLFTGNYASASGGGIDNTSVATNPNSQFAVTNCTFTENIASGGTDGLYNYSTNGPITLTNTIFYGDYSGELKSYSSVIATNCDIKGGFAGTGNIDADPLFFNVDTQHFATPADARLQPSSPCLRAGTASGAPATTLDGRTRPTPPSIGAYEVVPPGTADATTTTLFTIANPSFSDQPVTLVASVQGVGKLPTGTVTFTLDGVAKPAVPISSGGNQVSFTPSSLAVGSHTVVASYSGDATYAPSTSSALTQMVIAHISPQYVSPSGSDADPGTAARPKRTLQAAINATRSGDAVVVGDGTYAGPGDVDLDFGNRNLTVSSQNGAGATIIDCQGSSSANHRAFYLHGYVTSAVISGLTIRNGYVSSGYPVGFGGAIYNAGRDLTVQNCVLINNTSAASPSGDSGSGGGIYNAPQGSATFTVTNCILTGNAAGSGGGICNNNTGTSTLTNCILAGNKGSYGGGVSNAPQGGSALTVTNCTFTANTAVSGGGIYNNGIYSANGGSFILTNDVLYGNTGGDVNAGIPATVSHCDIQGGYAGTGNISADPLFVASPANLHLQGGSPCSGAGTSAGAPATDLDGNTRPNPPSIGAYEGSAALTAPASAVFAGLDFKAQGNWKGLYGADGYSISQDSAALPAYAAVALSGSANYTWQRSTADPRAPLRAAPGAGRLAACWYSPPPPGGAFDVDVNLTDGQAHRVALYCLSWDYGGGRRQTVTVRDAASGATLDAQTPSLSQGGVYAVWTIRGHVVFHITAAAGPNAVLSALFFDPNK